MFDVTWGELGLLFGVGLFLVGKKDLPALCHKAGQQVGRVVGLLQGARARADHYASQNELSQLQKELRAGLRELDMVKAEMAVSLTPSRSIMMGSSSGSGMGGGGYGYSSNPYNNYNPAISTQPQGWSGAAAAMMTSPSPPAAAAGNSLATVTTAATSTLLMPGTLPRLSGPASALKETRISDATPANAPTAFASSSSIPRSLPPARQTVGAVAEEEWVRRGIAFVSKAERGLGSSYDTSTTGSALLASLLHQTLLFDQYDRVVQEQDHALQSKVVAAKMAVFQKGQALAQQQQQKGSSRQGRTNANSIPGDVGKDDSNKNA